MIFLKFSNKSHNMISFFLLTYLYGENELLLDPVCPFGLFSQEKTFPVPGELICIVRDTFIKLSLSNIMKYRMTN